MTAKYVSDEIDMMITDHHMIGGYACYDHTQAFSQALKMKTTKTVASNRGMDYEKALTHICKSFVEEELVETIVGLQPLVNKLTCKGSLDVALTKMPCHR